MSRKKKQIRAIFRKEVFTRDNYTCVTCGKSDCDLDAHHIIARDHSVDGGYIKENGISLCEDCHVKAERYYWQKEGGINKWSPEALKRKINEQKNL